jgi:hypothetical protein
LLYLQHAASTNTLGQFSGLVWSGTQTVRVGLGASINANWSC